MLCLAVIPRPLAVTIIAWVYIVTGIGGFVAHLWDLQSQRSFPVDMVLAQLVSLVALVAGFYMLRGKNWARWLALAWMGFHVVISLSHPIPELVIHIVFFGIVGYFLFLSPASRYFHSTPNASNTLPGSPLK